MNANFNLKKRLTATAFGTIILGIGLLVSGIFVSERLEYMGSAILAVGIIKIARLILLFKNPKKYKEYETAYSDERNVYIAQKSYAAAFWVSVYAEFAALIGFSIAKDAQAASFLGFIICAQMIVFIAFYRIFGRKY